MAPRPFFALALAAFALSAGCAGAPPTQSTPGAVCDVVPSDGPLTSEQAVEAARAHWEERADGPPGNASASTRRVVLRADGMLFERAGGSCEALGGAGAVPEDGEDHDAWAVSLAPPPDPAVPTASGSQRWVAYVDASTGVVVLSQAVL